MDVEQEPRGWSIRLGSIDSTLTEIALVCLMAGMIIFSVYSIAPRPLQATPSETSLPTTTALSASGSGGDDNGEETAASSATATPLPLPTLTATPARATATPARAPAATSAAGKTYVVKPGDTLFSIARSHNVSVDALAKANALSDPKRLRAGQTLRIP